MVAIIFTRLVSINVSTQPLHSRSYVVTTIFTNYIHKVGGYNWIQVALSQRGYSDTVILTRLVNIDVCYCPLPQRGYLDIFTLT